MEAALRDHQRRSETHEGGDGTAAAGTPALSAALTAASASLLAQQVQALQLASVADSDGGDGGSRGEPSRQGKAANKGTQAEGACSNRSDGSSLEATLTHWAGLHAARQAQETGKGAGAEVRSGQ